MRQHDVLGHTLAVPTQIRVAPGQVIDIPVDPKTGPIEENPVIILSIMITDEKKNAPIKARLVNLGGQEVGRNVSELVIQLPGDLRDHPVHLHVEADNYLPWEMVMRRITSNIIAAWSGTLC